MLLRVIVAVISATLLNPAAAAASPQISAATHAGTNPVVLAASIGSPKQMLSQLPSAAERPAGFTGSSFPTWSATSSCNTRITVLVDEAVTKPTVTKDCTVTGGQWRSTLDGATVIGAARMRVDQLVPVSEAWQSGARDWTRAQRGAFVNDVSYGPSLLAMSKRAWRDRAAQEPVRWLPVPKARCTYLAQWVAVKWRWRLSVDTAERTLLHRRLAECGWPKVPTATRAPVSHGGGTSGGSGAGENRVTLTGDVAIPYEFNSFAGPLPGCGGVEEFAAIRVGASVVVYDRGRRVASGPITSCRWVNTGSLVNIGSGPGENWWQPVLSFSVPGVPNVSGLLVSVAGHDADLRTVRPNADIELGACDSYSVDLCLT
jgi:hypothetical protein